MFNVPHQVYTVEFKGAAVQRVKDGQGVSAVARELGMSTQTLRNWLKASEAGKLNGPGGEGRHGGTDGAFAFAGGEQALADGAGNRKKSGGVLREGMK